MPRNKDQYEFASYDVGIKCVVVNEWIQEYCGD